MNMLETSAVSNVSTLGMLRNDDVVLSAKGVEKPTNNSIATDKYVGKAANDAIFTGALSSALKQYASSPKRFDTAVAILPQPSAANYIKSRNLISSPEEMSNSVMANIERTIKMVSAKGATELEIDALKKQTIDGIEKSFVKAESELASLGGTEFSEKLSKAKINILQSINELDIPIQNKADKEASAAQLSDLQLKSGDLINVTFGLSNIKNASSGFIFTTSTNNVSIGVSGDSTDKTSQTQIMQLFNETDNLVNAFFKGNIELSFEKLKYTDSSISSLSNNAEKLVTSELKSSAKKYLQVAELTSDSLAAVNEFAQLTQYSSQLSETMRLADRIFASQNQYKEIINGIVNQLEDVQVPDLLSAINRIHTFNSNFV